MEYDGGTHRERAEALALTDTFSQMNAPADIRGTAKEKAECA